MSSDWAPPWTTLVLADSVPLPMTPQPVVAFSTFPLSSRLPPLPALNCHQLRLKRLPLPPVKRRYRSWVALAPAIGQEIVVHVCHPPVAGTVQVPTSVPVTLSRWSSIRPPLVAEATRAVNVVAPEPKPTPFTLIQSPLSIHPTFMPPSLEGSVSTPDSQAMVSASCRT